VLLFAWVLLGETITWLRLASLLLATLGVVAVIDPRSAQLNPDLFLGNLALIGAAVTWALYSVLVRKTTRDTDVLLFSLIAFLGGLPVTLPPSLTFFAQPVVGTLLGWLFLGERITPLFLIGGMLIGLGLLISTREK
jgi:drug/metabolite transporter (DMT)-like permease